MKFMVNIVKTSSWTIEVDANSEEEAKDEARFLGEDNWGSSIIAQKITAEAE